MSGNFYDIDNIFVNKEITESKFCCDLSACKGACCTMESQFGAPVNMDEVHEIEKILPVVLEYLTDEHVKAIKEMGFWEKKQGQELIKSINNRDCVFVYYSGDVAKCAIEKAYFEGKVTFRKPISCHLFPIRISEFGGPILRYEKYHECKPAEVEGEKNGITILEFCKDSLERAFGSSWYEKMLNNLKGG